MSRGRWGIQIRQFTGAAAVVAALGGVFARAALAQDTGQYERMVKSLLADAERAEDEWERERDRMNVRALDSIQIGTLTIVTAPSDAEWARPGLEEAWARIVAHLGSDTTLLEGVRINLTRRGRTFFWGTGDPATAWTTLRADADLDEVADRVSHQALRLVLVRVATELRRWAGFTLGGALSESLRWTYVGLATSQFEIGRRCLASDLEACVTGLGLQSDADLLTRVFTPRERRELARARYRTRLSDMWQRCVDGGVDSACLEFLRSSSESWNPGSTALPQTVRASLVEFAIQSGGDGALGRLASSHDLSIAQQLAAAANTPFDSLIESWHTAVLDARPVSTTMTAGVALAGFFWAGLLLAMAMRGVRWRIG